MCFLKSGALAVLALFSLALLPGLYAQESSSVPSFGEIATDLDRLESLITDTQANNERLERQLKALEENLSERESLLTGKEASMIEQETLLKELRSRLDAMSQTYREQSDLSRKSAKSSKFWRTFTLIGIPAAALLSGGLTAAWMGGR